MAPERVGLVIVGAGPAGLSAAVEAARLGLRSVVVLEREAVAGGTVRHCGHLGFGMLDLGRFLTGPAYAARLAERARGLDIRLAHAVTGLDADGTVEVSTPAGALNLRADRVLVATGIRETPRAGRLVSGNRPFGVLTTGALQRFVYLEGRLPCRRPVVVGSELVAFSTLLTLRHAGTRPVAILEPGRRVAAGPLAAPITRLAYGVPVVTGAGDMEILGLRHVEGVAFSADGRRESLDCDAVVFTGGWVPEAHLFRAGDLPMDRFTGGPAVDTDLRLPGTALFAAGNVRYGVRSSGPCALEGRHAARVIAAELGASKAVP